MLYIYIYSYEQHMCYMHWPSIHFDVFFIGCHFTAHFEFHNVMSVQR